MKRKARFIENLLLTLLLLGGMMAIYLYAGRQEQLSAAENTSPANQTETAAAEIIIPEVSGDGRLRSAVLSAFCEAGYVVRERETDDLELLDTEGRSIARVLLSLKGERVSGLTLRIPLPQKPETQKKPTLIEQALLDRYDAETELLQAVLPNLLETALSAIDPYETLPSTARLYWKDLLLDALHGDRAASDAGQPIRMKIYEFSELGEGYLCMSLEIKQ